MTSPWYVALVAAALSVMMTLQGCASLIDEEAHLLAQGCGILREEVNEYGEKYIAEQVPKMCSSTPGIDDPAKCYQLVRQDLANAIMETSDEVVHLCSQCLMNMSKPIFAEYDGSLVEMVGNYSKIAREVNSTLLKYCKMTNVISAANLTTVWNKPLMDALKQTTNSSWAFQKALAANGLQKLYEQQQEIDTQKRHSVISKVAAGSAFVIMAGVAMVAWRRHSQGSSVHPKEFSRLKPDKHLSRELFMEDTDITEETVLTESQSRIV